MGKESKGESGRSLNMIKYTDEILHELIKFKNINILQMIKMIIIQDQPGFILHLQEWFNIGKKLNILHKQT